MSSMEDMKSLTSILCRRAATGNKLKMTLGLPVYV